ncbi:tRNA (N6-threonylcarbamoyladenosine(37)-N6)-methyltransferase TrmO [Rhodohalobacter sp. 8-1]|uniref:tRNA (N6-threonylcarbamoyladenosine(37)-N6)-methyltransferase TrmO n=1 Tax=Rhodohalobacter sp. 8-1 TaxID=3131972 RepID=UPI0030EBEC56
MNSTTTYSIRPIGFVHSQLIDKKDAPEQGSEGAPEACIKIDKEFTKATDGIVAGSEIILLTWLHLSDRNVLQVHPRNNPNNPLKGVFATRAPDRPNPIGLHRVQVLETAESVNLIVSPLEAVDGTPVIDIKPVLCNQH